MNEGRDATWDAQVEGISTIEASRRFLSSLQRHEAYSKAKWLRHPFQRATRKWRIPAFLRVVYRTSVLLRSRYAGVERQLVRRAGIATAEGETMVHSAIWGDVATGSLKLTDPRRFSTLLWEVIADHTQMQCRELKPKFMLRQFVDQMPSCDERGVMRSVVYGEGVAVLGEETGRQLAKAFPLLHHEVLRLSSDLTTLTDSTLNADDARDFEPPFEEYRRWLLNS